MALEAIIKLTADLLQDEEPTPPFFILADNQAALSTAFSPDYRPGQQLRFQLLQLYHKLLKLSPQVSLSLVWVPGHRDVEGNELADEWAKKAAAGELEEVVSNDEGAGDSNGRGGERSRGSGISTESSLNFPKSSTSLLATFKLEIDQQWATQWSTSPDSKYLKRIDLHPPSAHILR
ncbi:hypothetical protein JCM5350_007589, partial [Sporobolomyces pararoseus]